MNQEFGHEPLVGGEDSPAQRVIEVKPSLMASR